VGVAGIGALRRRDNDAAMPPILSTPRGADDTCRPLATAKFFTI
jgi:hypothetical protein